MSDDATQTDGDTIPTTGAPSPDGGTALQLVTQFVKDLSFENPNMLQQLSKLQQAAKDGQQLEQPKLNFNLSVNVQQVGPESFDVTLSMKLEGQRGDETAFILELAYAGLVAARAPDREALSEVLYVDCPRLLFPFARAMIADVTRDGGLQPIVLNPIDFAELYRQQREKAGGPGPIGGADAPTEGTA